ncbi:hypothetical protein [Ezakiella coagulans]|uniref:hypothetical protein n=1 Tax=Ezakiella coagulans TaxID=46507 RepID=UPI00288B54BD|nr:hypothetical protein [Ezakiella coagulans]
MAEFKQKKIEVEGVEYTLQKMPIREALKLRQRWSSKETASGVDDIKMAELCLENIVVMPKMKLDDFDSIDALEKLIVECVNFQYLGK